MNSVKFTKVIGDLSVIWDRVVADDVLLFAGYAGVDSSSISIKFSDIVDKILSQNSFRQQCFIEGAEWLLKQYLDPEFDDIKNPCPIVGNAKNPHNPPKMYSPTHPSYCDDGDGGDGDDGGDDGDQDEYSPTCSRVNERHDGGKRNKKRTKIEDEDEDIGSI
jgi:hypothetical protein